MATEGEWNPPGTCLWEGLGAPSGRSPTRQLSGEARQSGDQGERQRKRKEHSP